MKLSLVSLESHDPTSEKMEGIYKTDNFINDFACGASLFVFFDLNTYFQLQFAVQITYMCQEMCRSTVLFIPHTTLSYGSLYENEPVRSCICNLL